MAVDWRVRPLLAVLIIGAVACTPASPTSPAPTTPASPTLPAPTDQQEPSPTAVATSADEIGPAETGDLTLAIRLPNVRSQAPWFIAMDQGYYEEEGLTIEVITTDAAREGVVGGSVAIAADTLGATLQSYNEGLPFQIIGSHFCGGRNLIAVAPGIESVEDLEGENILLGAGPGDPNFEFRENLLREGGWDLDAVDVNAVNIPGSSDAWVEAFVNGQIALAPLFERHIAQVQDYGGTIVVDVFVEGPAWVEFTTAEFAEQNPNAVARYLRATMRAIAFYMDLSNKDAVLDIMERHGFDVSGREAEFYEEGPTILCEDMRMEPETYRDEAARALIEPIPPFEEIVATELLDKAQSSLGLD